jgi:signal transduction histidine kinase
MKMNHGKVTKEQAAIQSDLVGETGINHKEVYEEEKKRILIRDYLSDRKSVILLFLSTSLVYIIICSLYQLHNLSKILYAFLITLFIWCCYASFDLTRYIQKRRKLRLARNYPELTAEALFGAGIPDIFPRREGEQYTITQQLSELEKAYVSLIDDLCRSHRALESEAELRLGEMTDYYMMWAHQIKTPIAGIKLLINGREDGFLLMEELFKIEQYVEMVLHYLRLESMSSDTIIKQHDLQSLVKQTVRKYSVLFINSGLSLQLEDFNVKVLTDEKWLCFVLEQIISNSIKYTKKGTISIYMKPDTQKTLVIEDTGIGIRQEDIPRIFDRGFTGYNGHLDKKSTGIGLYLCKQIMNQLSHGISVSSKEGEGTKFYLELSRDSFVEHAD